MNRSELFWGGLGVAVGYTVGRRILKRVDEATGEQGAAAGIKVLLAERNTHTTAVWDGDKEHTKQILSDHTKPTVIVSNHPHKLEPFMMLSEIPPRKGLSIIAKAGNDVLLGKELRRNIVRVYHPKRFETPRQIKKRKERNRAQIQEALNRLESGGSIFIAPDGGDGSGKWKGGSVKLFEKALTLPEAYLLMGYVPDSTAKEHWRMVFKRKLERRVYISEAIDVKNIPIPNGSDTKNRHVVFSNALQKYYDSWANSK